MRQKAKETKEYRYVRTNSGDLWELWDNKSMVYKNPHSSNFITDDDPNITKRADEIKNLVKAEDLIFYGNRFCSVPLRVAQMDLMVQIKPLNNIVALYTKQGDNYILVWDKERGVV